MEGARPALSRKASDQLKPSPIDRQELDPPRMWNEEVGERGGRFSVGVGEEDADRPRPLPTAGAAGGEEARV